MVSVPFRGISFPNIKAEKAEFVADMVSVPFRGISFPNDDEVLKVKTIIEFPSPSGASHFLIDSAPFAV